jgi:hypothetical protein
MPGTATPSMVLLGPLREGAKSGAGAAAWAGAIPGTATPIIVPFELYGFTPAGAAVDAGAAAAGAGGAVLTGLATPIIVILLLGKLDAGRADDAGGAEDATRAAAGAAGGGALGAAARIGDGAMARDAGAGSGGGVLLAMATADALKPKRVACEAFATEAGWDSMRVAGNGAAAL